MFYPSQRPQCKARCRLGKKSDSARPLKVVMENGATAEEVLRKARSVKLASIQIARDRTKVESEEYKRLRNDLKERSDRGEDDLVIRGGFLTHPPALHSTLNVIHQEEHIVQHMLI